MRISLFSFYKFLLNQRHLIGIFFSYSYIFHLLFHGWCGRLRNWATRIIIFVSHLKTVFFLYLGSLISFEWHTKEKIMLEKYIIWWYIFRWNTFLLTRLSERKYFKSLFQLSPNFLLMIKLSIRYHIWYIQDLIMIGKAYLYIYKIKFKIDVYKCYCENRNYKIF